MQDRFTPGVPKTPLRERRVSRLLDTRRRTPPEAKPLTDKQQKFVDELVANDGLITLKEAAARAGYGSKNASTIAYQLTNPRMYPQVVAAIKRAKEEQDMKHAIDYHRHLRDLQRIRDAALQNGAYGAAVQAEYRRGQAHGNIYIHKSEIRHGSIDTMSKDEVLRALEEINKQSRIIDITPQGGETEGRDNLEGSETGVRRLSEAGAGPEGPGVDLDEG